MADTTTPASTDTSSTVDHLAAKANVAYQSASQTLREQTDAVVRRIQPQIDAVSSYARNEPTKAILISAATGAALMGLVALMVRSGGSSRPDVREVGSTARSTLAAIRGAAMDLADHAQGIAQNALDVTYRRTADAIGEGEQRASDTMSTAQNRANDTMGTAQKRAHDALSTAQKRAADAADSVTETVADAWKSLRDQAGPMVDKLRPQIAAATSYARDEPARAALGIAAAGAVLIGLMALLRSSDSDSEL